MPVKLGGDAGVQTDLRSKELDSAKEISSQNDVGKVDSKSPDHSQLRGTDAMGGVRDVPATRSDKTITFGNIKIHGVDFAAIKEGTIKLHLPLNRGRSFEIPTALDPVKLHVKNDTIAELTVKIGRPDGVPVITEAQLELNNDVVIRNPASALKPFKIFEKIPALNTLVNKLADAAADMHIAGIYVDQSGTVHMPGHISKLGILKSDLDPEVQGSFPKLNMKLGKIAKEGVIAAAPTDPGEEGGKPVSLTELLKAIGAVTQEATYSVDLITDPTVLEVDAPQGHASTEKAPIELHLDGKAELDKDAFLHIHMDPGAARVRTGVADIDASGSLHLFAPELRGKGSLTVDVKTRLLTGELEQSGIHLPFVLEPGGTVHAVTDLMLDGMQVSLKNGDGAWHLAAATTGVDTDDGVSLNLGTATITTDGHTPFSFGKDGLVTQNGELRVEVVGDDLVANLSGIEVSLPGGVKALLTGQDVALDGSALAGHGEVDYEIPGLATRSVDYIIDSRGLALDGQQLSHVLPLSLDGHPEKIVDPTGPAAGSFDSVAGMQGLMDKVTEVTSAEVRPNNSIRLLAEGDASHSARLAMINGAGKGDSVCLQTLIFKDDATGTENAEALAAAARRGAKVKVLVDTLGNVTGLDDLIDGKKIYQTMRAAGVEVQLYNDAGAQALQQIIALCNANDDLPSIENLEQINDPQQGLKIFGDLFRAAKEDSGLPSDLRAQVRDGLTQLSAAMTEKGVQSLDFRDINPDGRVSKEELVILIEHVTVINHRTHQKRLAVVHADGTAEAIVGGRNVADEYLLGEGQLYGNAQSGDRRPAWRDTDIYIKGEAARDAFVGIGPMWEHCTGQPLETLPAHVDAADQGNVKVQNVEHLPRLGGDHRILNAEIEIVKSLGAGDVYYAANAYLCMEGAMGKLKEALIAAAERGAEIHLVTNSPDTTDLADINHVAIFSYRDMMRAGIHIYERLVGDKLDGADTGSQTIHSKTAVARKKDGAGVSRISSWNNDSRSASLNAENAAYVWGDDALNNELQAVIEAEIAVSKEIMLADIDRQPFAKEIDASIRLALLGKVL